MIKPEDIKIGDLVRVCCDCAFPNGTLCIVNQVYPSVIDGGKTGIVDLLCVDGTTDHIVRGVWCVNVEGIPLTPEILKKNDFNTMVPGRYTQSMGDTSRVLKRYISIECRDSGWAVFLKYDSLPDHVLIRKIQYVHELQHILWALGLNAELKV